MKERDTFLSRLRTRCAGRLRRARRRGEDGSVVVEFAIIAPIFFFLMFVIAETALVFVAEQVLDSAVFETARLIRTGQVHGMTKDEFKQEVCGRVSIFMDCTSTNFYMDVESFDSFDDIEQQLEPPAVNEDDEFEQAGTLSFGTASKIVVMRVYYQWPTRTIPLVNQSVFGGASGKRLIGSFAAFCNEPYSSGAGQCGG